MGQKTLTTNSGTTYDGNVMRKSDICVIKHGLKIPVDAVNYDDFASNIKIKEQEFQL